MLTKDPKKRINWKELFEKELKEMTNVDRKKFFIIPIGVP